jgi:hypothetical protein
MGSTGPWAQADSRFDKYGGNCRYCGKYDVELVDGYCRDESCKADRLVNALLKGEARRFKDGTIIWTPGIQTFK